MKKIQLVTVDEITKALVEGKTICEDFCTTEKFRTIKLINGICVSKYHKGMTVVNEYFTIDEERNFYYEEKEPIKLEVGKFYRTRDGKRVMCFYKYKTPYLYGYAIIKLDCVPQNAIYRVDENGLVNTQTETIDDIVDYWE